MSVQIAQELMEEWSKCDGALQRNLLNECEQLLEARFIVELLEAHPELLGALLSIDDCGRVRFGLKFSARIRLELILGLQELWEQAPELDLFQRWSPFLLDTSWFNGLEEIDMHQLSDSELRTICRWCAHFGSQESRVIPKVFFRSLPMRSDRSGSAAQPVVLGHRFVIQKYPITQAMYAFWMRGHSISSPAKPQVFDSVFDVLRLCNLISVAQGRQPIYGPSELLKSRVNIRSLSSVERIGRGYSGVELEELMDSITINLQADGWRIPSEVEWECAAKAQLKITDPHDSRKEQESCYFDYVGGDHLLEVGCVRQDLNGDLVSDAVGQKRLNGRGVSDMSGAIPELCWGEGFPVYFEDMIHPISILKDPFLYGTDEEERQQTGVWSTRGGPFGSLKEALEQRTKRFAVRLVRTVS